MRYELIGILVLQCKCDAKYVVSTEQIKNGFHVTCPCGQHFHCNRYSIPTFEIRQSVRPEYLNKAAQKKFYKPVGEAMPLAEYKMLLADFVTSGKPPRLKKEHKTTVQFDNNDAQVNAAYEALLALGFSSNEAKTKLEVALSAGLRMDADLIKHVLTL